MLQIFLAMWSNLLSATLPIAATSAWNGRTVISKVSKDIVFFRVSATGVSPAVGDHPARFLLSCLHLRQVQFLHAACTADPSWSFLHAASWLPGNLDWYSGYIFWHLEGPLDKQAHRWVNTLSLCFSLCILNIFFSSTSFLNMVCWLVCCFNY